MSFDRIILFVAAFGVAVGTLDKILGNRWGLGEKLDDGFHAMGPLALSMAGIVCLAPLLAKVLGPVLSPVLRLIGADPALCGSLLANDMGGYALARELAEDPEAGYFAGNIAASMLGCTLVFSVPVGLGILPKDRTEDFARGLLIGMLTIPMGCLAGGFIAGFSPKMVLLNTIPIAFLSLLLAVGLWKIPCGMVKGFLIFGKGVSILAAIGLALGAISYLTGLDFLPDMTPVTEALATVAQIGLVLLGIMPLLELLTRILKKPLGKLSALLKLDSVSTAGLILTAANSVPVYSMMKDMKRRGVIVNTAWLVSATCMLGDHLGFTAGTAPEMILPMILGKLAGGLTAAALALFLTRDMTD